MFPSGWRWAALYALSHSSYMYLDGKDRSRAAGGLANRDMHLKCHDRANDSVELLLICHLGLNRFPLYFDEFSMTDISGGGPSPSISNISVIIKLVHG